MKKIVNNLISTLIAGIPAVAAFAMIVSANSIASPMCGQPIPPVNLKKYRKF